MNAWGYFCNNRRCCRTSDLAGSNPLPHNLSRRELTAVAVNHLTADYADRPVLDRQVVRTRRGRPALLGSSNDGA